MINPIAHSVNKMPAHAMEFSICTLVRDAALYNVMLETFLDQGFTPDYCEFLYVDNREKNYFDGYSGYNLFLAQAQGQYVILCHEDIRLLESRDALLKQIAALKARDPHWAVLGNAGGDAIGELAYHISDAKGDNRRLGILPQRVYSLDENFVLVRASAGLSCSRDLEGFHFYATDLCLNAEVLGYSCYVVDFHVRHLGGASLNKQSLFNAAFAANKRALIRKHGKNRRNRFLQTPNARLFFCSNPLLSWLGNRKFVISTARKLRRFKILMASFLKISH